MSLIEIKSQEDFDAMFLSNDAHKLRYQELEVFIKCLGRPAFVFNHCDVISNPDEGMDFAEFVQENVADLWRYLISNNHKMKDKGGDWCCGGMGSRWADFELFRGVTVRLAYYSRKSDTKIFDSIKGMKDIRKDNLLLICKL